jgi:hypothetical protein
MVQFFSRLTIEGDQGGIYKVLIGSDPANLSTFTEIYSATELEINPIQTEYAQKFVNIPAMYQGQQLHIAFFMQAENQDRWLIDDVSIITSCNSPSQLTATNITPASVDLGWTENGEATSWEIDVVSATAIPSGVGIVVTANPFNVTTTTNGEPIAPGAYKYYVRAICGDGAKSNWSGPFYFSTDVALNNALHGVVKADTNGDGVCDANDLSVPNAQIAVAIDGEPAYTIYADYNGEYTLYGLPDGEYTIDLQVAETNIFPEIPVVTQEVAFDLEANELTISHCLPEPEPLNDLGVFVSANSNSVPGFDVTYVVTGRNFGTEAVADASITLNFDTARLDYVSANSLYPVTVSGNTITIALGDMPVYAYKGAGLKFHVKEPPLNIGEESLVFTASLSDVENDIDMSNNIAVYNTVITNSFDPNDITVHEGAEILETQANDYLTYTIRFQNTGNGNAVNVKLENTLDELLDWDTFQPLTSSHTNSIKRTDGELEFSFENIQLPYESIDEPASHGYVTYRIKPKAGFGVGDMVSNTAEIYFDFNEAIVTNTATTKVVALAGLNNTSLALAKLYPNPVKDQLIVEVAQGELQLVTIHDVNGRQCLSANAGAIDTNSLTSGIYFVKVTTDAGSANYKIIKQ